MTRKNPAGGMVVTLLTSGVLALCSAGAAQAGDIELDPEFTPAVEFVAEEIPTFPDFEYPRVNGIDDDGNVAGTHYACPFILSCLSQTYLYDGRELIHTSEEMIGAVPAPFVGVPVTIDMSDTRKIVVRMAVPDVGVYHYLWDDGETLLISGDPDDLPGKGPLVPMPPPPGSAWAVNDSGTVTGSVNLGTGPRAFLWNRTEGVTTLIDPPNGFDSIGGRDINNHGHIAGITTAGGFNTVRGFMWVDGELTILEPLPGHIRSQAVLINDDGVVVGTSRQPTQGNHVNHLVMWQDGKVIDSVILNHPGGLIQEPLDISEGNGVVGYYWPTAESASHFGFRWTPEHGFHQLNSTITNIQGLHVWAAEGINEQGQIAAWADDQDFSGGAYILTPNFETPGDLNNDGVVDEDDRAILCAALGSSQGEPGFIGAADLNDDGELDEHDQQLFNDIAPPCAGDVVTSDTFEPPADGTTDGADLAFLLGAWANEPSCADFVTSTSFMPPPDGVVDGADLAYLLGAWGNCE